MTSLSSIQKGDELSALIAALLCTLYMLHRYCISSHISLFYIMLHPSGFSIIALMLEITKAKAATRSEHTHRTGSEERRSTSWSGSGAMHMILASKDLAVGIFRWKHHDQLLALSDTLVQASTVLVQISYKHALENQVRHRQLALN